METKTFSPMQNIQLLQASVDETEESHFRFLIDGKTVKYVTIAGGIFESDDLCFAPTLLTLLPTFPNGDWNDGYIARSPDADTASFVRVRKREFPAVTSGWHPILLEHVDISFGDKLRSGIYKATHSMFPNSVVVKFARFEWDVPAIDRECRAYRWIQGKAIGPEFLGHVSEDGRVNGFMLETITGARHATPSDLALCQKVLARLHELDILHGDVNKHNFLIKDGRAIFIDFECARLSKDKSALDKEMTQLEDELHDTSGRGGIIVEG